MYKHLYHQPMTEQDIDVLVERIRDGDTLSMKYLISNNIMLILSFLSNCGPHRYDAMHDILPHIMRAVELYDSSKGSFTGFIRGAVKFGMVERSRYDKAYKRNPENREKLADHVRSMRPRTPSPEDMLMRKEYRQTRHRAILEAMEGLSIRERYFVGQYYLKGRTLMDLAEEEGVSFQAVQQAIKKAVERMRPFVEAYADDLR